MQPRAKVQEGNINLKPETLDPAYAEGLRKGDAANISADKRKKANDAWMEKRRQGDYSGPILDRSRSLALRNTAVE
eukprot:3774680-Karenia_brevis.AAC.1